MKNVKENNATEILVKFLVQTRKSVCINREIKEMQDCKQVECVMKQKYGSLK